MAPKKQKPAKNKEITSAMPAESPKGIPIQEIKAKITELTQKPNNSDKTVNNVISAKDLWTCLSKVNKHLAQAANKTMPINRISFVHSTKPEKNAKKVLTSAEKGDIIIKLSNARETEARRKKLRIAIGFAGEVQ